jgi:hypothetical protein
MEIARGKICPFCGHADSATTNLCSKCGKELHLRDYKVVSDGDHFGIAVNGKVILRNLSRANAQDLVTVLNDFKQDGVA